MAFNFLKSGADSVKLAKQAEVEAQKRREESGKLFRFWLSKDGGKDGKGEEARITFVDGDLGPDGFLVPPRYYEHNLYLNGSWNNYHLCPEKTTPETKDSCPICESGDRPALIALFTVIDHREFKGKNDKVYKDTKKLLAVKTQTFEYLNKLATKRGGLAGCTFDVMRVGDKSAAVGSNFDFIEKKDIKVLQGIYQEEKVNPTSNLKIKQTYFTPADYEKEIIFRDGDTLRKLGLGKSSSPGTVASPAGNAAAQTVDYSKQL